MKTIKITEEAHKNLTELQMKLYLLHNKKYTFSQVIERFFIQIEEPRKKYNFNDGEHNVNK